VIRADGRVENAHAIADPATAGCVDETLSTIAFPIDDGISEVSYRFSITREALRYGTTVADAGIFVR